MLNILMREKQNGFTLLEVLIALVILSLAFSASFFSLSATTRNMIALQDKTAAQWVAMNVIAQAQTGAIDIPKGSGSTNGNSKMFTNDWYWNLVISPSPDKYVSQLSVSVAKNRNGKNLVVLNGYLIQGLP